MLSVSNEYLQAINADTRNMTYRVTIGGATLGKDKVTNMSFTESVSDSNGISLGTSNSASVKLTIRDAEPMDYNGLSVEPESGLTLPDGTIEWIPLGKFWVTNFDTKNDFKTLTLTCADGMYNLSDEYESELEYPTTIEAVINELVVKSGVNFIIPSSYPNVIVRRKPNKMTFRNAFGYAAGCCGKNARFNRDGALEFVWYADTGLSIEREIQYMDGMTKLGNKSLEVDFKVKGITETYTVNIVTDGNGSVTATPYSSVLEGDTVTLSVSPYTNYELATITAKTADGKEVTLTEDAKGTGYSFVQPDSNVTVTVSFRQDENGPFAISTSTDGHGLISTNTTLAEAGETVTVTLVPDNGHSLKSFVTIPASLALTKVSENTYTFVVPKSDVTIMAYFDDETAYTIERIIDYQDMNYTPGYIIITNETRGGTTYYAGDTIAVCFARAIGHEFDHYEANVTLTQIDNDDFKFIMPEHNVSITAYFVLERDEEKEGIYSFLEHPSRATPPKDKPYWAVFYKFDRNVGANARYYLVWFDSWQISGSQTIAGRTGYTLVMDGYYYCGSLNNGNGFHRWDNATWMGNGASGSTLSWGVTLSRWEDGYGIIASNNTLIRNGQVYFQKCDTSIGEEQTYWLKSYVDIRDAGAFTRYPCPDTYSTPLPGAHWLVTNDAQIYVTDEDGDYSRVHSGTGIYALYFDSVAVENVGKHFTNVDYDHYKLTFSKLTVVSLLTSNTFGSKTTIDKECYIVIGDPNYSCSALTSIGGANEHTNGLIATNYTFDSVLDFANNSVIVCDCEPATYRMRSMIGVENVEIEYSNPFIYEQAVSSVQNAIEGISYTPVKVKHRGNPALQAGDIVTVPDGDGMYHNVLIMSQTMTFGGGMNSELTCPGQTSKTSSFNAGSYTSELIDQKVSEASSQLENKLGNNNSQALSSMYKAMSATKKETDGSIALLETQIMQTADEIEFNVVKNDEVVSKINLSEEGVLIDADRVDIEQLFAKNINMSGAFTATSQAYVPPNEAVPKRIQNHLWGRETIPDAEIPLYDFTGDGKIQSLDGLRANNIMGGYITMEEGHANAQLTDVTVAINPSVANEMIKISGTDMWGQDFKTVVGARSVTVDNINATNVETVDVTADYIKADTVEGSIITSDINGDSCVDWYMLDVTAEFTPYTEDSTPRCRKVGAVVNVQGVLKPTTSFTSSSTGVAMTASGLPEGFSPKFDIVTVCQGTGMNRWALRIRSDGILYMERYGGTSYATVPDTAWLPFNVTYFV